VSLLTLALVALVALPIVGLLSFAGCVISHATRRAPTFRLVAVPADANVTAVDFAVTGGTPASAHAAAADASGTWGSSVGVDNGMHQVTCTPVARPGIAVSPPVSFNWDGSMMSPIDFHLEGAAGSYRVVPGTRPGPPGSTVTVQIVLEAPPADANVTGVAFTVSANGTPQTVPAATHEADGRWTASVTAPPGSWQVTCDPAASPDIAASPAQTVAVDATTTEIVFHVEGSAGAYTVAAGPAPPGPMARLTLRLTFTDPLPPGFTVTGVTFDGRAGPGTMLPSLGAAIGDRASGYSLVVPARAGDSWTVAGHCAYTVGGTAYTERVSRMDTFTIAGDEVHILAMSWPGQVDGDPANTAIGPSD
jgi:hypothetical protein